MRNRRASGMRAAFPSALVLLAVAGLGQMGRWLPLADIVNSVAPIVAVCASALILLAWRRRLGGKVAGLAILALLLAGERILPEMVRAAPPAADGRKPGDVTVVSFNLWRENSDPERALRAIRQARADILLLQEAEGTFWPHLEALAADFPYRTPCSKPPCSVMILSRWPLDRSIYGFRKADGHAFGPGLIQARITPPDGLAFRVASTHLARPFRNRQGQRALRDQLAVGALGSGDSRLVLAGDFNLTPWSFALQRLDAAIVPMVRADRGQPTYPARFLPVLPIDHVYVGPGWQLHSAERLSPGGSDHRGLRIVLRPI